jgi:hypothetical protein
LSRSLPCIGFLALFVEYSGIFSLFEAICTAFLPTSAS